MDASNAIEFEELQALLRKLGNDFSSDYKMEELLDKQDDELSQVEQELKAAALNMKKKTDAFKQLIDSNPRQFSDVEKAK